MAGRPYLKKLYKFLENLNVYEIGTYTHMAYFPQGFCLSFVWFRYPVI